MSSENRVRRGRLHRIMLVALNIYPDAIAILILAGILETVYRLGVWLCWIGRGAEFLSLFGLSVASLCIVVARLPRALRMWWASGRSDPIS
jgi:hypothetical protein